MTKFNRLVIACTAFAKFPIAAIAEQFGISRNYIYSLLKKLPSDLEQDPFPFFSSLCETVFPDRQIISGSPKFYEKMVVSLALDGNASEEGIQRILENNFQVHLSIGKISAILNRAADCAAEFDASIDLSGIRQGANDEIFQCGTPVLTGVDPVSTYIYLLQQAENRSADTWQAAMENCKQKGLSLEVSISDFGAGLLSGIPKAFPQACIQPDLFHWLMELGKEISSIERKTYGMLTDYYQWEQALSGQRVHEKTLQKLLALEEKLPAALDCCDDLVCLYQWLREMTGYYGYRYTEVLPLCHWILDQMEKVEGITGKLRKILEKTRKNLPDVLSYLKRAEEAFRESARKSGYPEESFLLMYWMQRYHPTSMEYHAADRRLRHSLGKKYAEAYLRVEDILNGVKRASSLVENLNGRLRCYMNLKRMVPEKFLTLLKVYFNTKKYRRSRKPDRIGKSPLELLTKREHPDFYDIVCGR